MLRSILFIAILWLSTPPLWGVDGSYHAAEAQKGDGIFSMLRRFQLNEHNCNRTQFYKLNDLSSESKLLAGKSYILPIKVYTYNGESIRSTIGIQDYDQALSIAHYNNALTESGIKSGYYQKDKVLWVPHHLVECSTSKTDINVSVKAKEFITEPLFGSEHERIEIIDQSMKGKVFYIISGHGGPDPGAQGRREKSTLSEDEYAYDVSLRLYRNLLQHGATAYMIIQDENDGIRSGKYLASDHDEKCMGKAPIPLNQTVRLDQRTQAVNHLYKIHKKRGAKEQTMISIHIDSRSISRRQDVFFYYFRKSKSGKKLAEQVLETFREKYKINRRDGSYHGTVSSRDLYVLKNTRPTALFVELANIQNANDQKRIIYETNRQALADWLYLGLSKSN